MRKLKRGMCLILATAMLMGTQVGCGNTASGIRDMTTMEIVQDMGLGINLGNTFESCGDWIDSSSVTNYETGWGSPVITQEMIQGYVDCGFGVLRIPVAWSNMMGDNYTINDEYLARVTEVVDWAMDAGLYVILNIHWDMGWWDDFPTDYDTCMEKYTRIWEQLCAAYKDYDDHLIFESLNEEGCWDSLWNHYGGDDGKEEAYALLNDINQTFVDLVRKSGGNNKKRHLLIAGYATDVTLTCDELFEMPKDSANHLAVSVHYYTPSTFCILEEDASWGKAVTEWGSAADLEELEYYMDMLQTTFIDNGIPVIMGEYGVSTGNKTDEMVNYYLTTVCESMYEHGICPVLWSTTGNFYDRTNCCFYSEELLEGLMAVLED